MEEFRKTLCSLWQGSQTAFSPDSLFYAIWKIMPSFRYATVKQFIRISSSWIVKSSVFCHCASGQDCKVLRECSKMQHTKVPHYSEVMYCMFVYPGVISSRMPTSSCVTCWTTSTGSFSTVAMVHLALCHLQMASDWPPQRGNAACEPVTFFPK